MAFSGVPKDNKHEVKTGRIAAWPYRSVLPGGWEFENLEHFYIPEPLRPTIARLSPASRLKLMFFRVGSEPPG